MFFTIVCPYCFFYDILDFSNNLFFVVNSVEKTYICNVKDFIQHGKR